jgi:hypothetical protein
MFNYVPIKGKFKLYTVLNGLIFPIFTQPKISFERAILLIAQGNVDLFTAHKDCHECVIIVVL